MVLSFAFLALAAAAKGEQSVYSEKQDSGRLRARGLQRLPPNFSWHTLSTGNKSVDLPAISEFETYPADLVGAKLTLECGAQGAFDAEFTESGFDILGAIFKDTNDAEVGRLEYLSNATTHEGKISLDLIMESACDSKILTIDLRPACKNDAALVFDIDVLNQLSPGSFYGRLIILGGGCWDPVPVLADYSAGLDGAAPLGDLWQSLTFDFGSANCTFDSELIITVDSDVTLSEPGTCVPEPVAACQESVVALVGEGDASLLDGGSFHPDGDALSFSVADETMFNTAGVYENVVLTVEHDVFSHKSAMCTVPLVVIYDTTDGFVVRGNGEILDGDASFEFVARYNRNNRLVGGFAFEFDDVGVDFASTSYEWLVVDGVAHTAQLMGTGTISGSGEHSFHLWVEDGSPDTFRLRIDGVYDSGSKHPLTNGRIVIRNRN